jgi:hypothetical protein
VLDGSCSVDGFWRFVNTSRPASPLGDCYLAPAVLRAIKCEPQQDATGPLCAVYRRHCPMSCGVGRLMDGVALRCVSVTAPQQHETSLVALLVVLALLCAAQLIVVVFLALRLRASASTAAHRAAYGLEEGLMCQTQPV